MAEIKDYCKILGINKTNDLSEIRKNYKQNKQKALKWHPDKNPNNIKEAEEKMKEINEAYEISSDESKRKKYDDGENVSVEKYGYDYGEEIPVGESALVRYKNNLDELNSAWLYLHYFSADTDGYRTQQGKIGYINAGKFWK